MARNANGGGRDCGRGLSRAARCGARGRIGPDGGAGEGVRVAALLQLGCRRDHGARTDRGVRRKRAMLNAAIVEWRCGRGRQTSAAAGASRWRGSRAGAAVVQVGAAGGAPMTVVAAGVAVIARLAGARGCSARSWGPMWISGRAVECAGMDELMAREGGSALVHQAAVIDAVGVAIGGQVAVLDGSPIGAPGLEFALAVPGPGLVRDSPPAWPGGATA